MVERRSAAGVRRVSQPSMRRIATVAPMTAARITPVCASMAPANRHVRRASSSRRQQPGLVELPGPHLAQHPVRKRLLRDLELRRRHHTPRGCSPIRDLRAVPFDRANEQPHPHRGRRSTGGSCIATPSRRERFEAAREESRFAWRRASTLPARFAGAPSARGRLCVSCRHGSPSSTNDRSSGVPGSHQRRQHHGVAAGSAVMTAHPTATTSARPVRPSSSR